MTHEHKLRRSFNIAAIIMGDKWICKLCGKYCDYDEMLSQQKVKATQEKRERA